jgi:hypothetical protein
MVIRGAGIALPAWIGMELGCAGGYNQLVRESPPRLDVDLHIREEAMFCTPLSSCPPTRLGFAKSEGDQSCCGDIRWGF